MTESREPLAIIGIGCLFPKAAGLADYWANIKAKVDGIGPVPPTHWNPDDYFDADPKRPDMTYARRGGFLDPYPFPPAEFGIAPNDLEATDTSQLLALVVAKMALDDSGLDKSAIRNPQSEIRTSVILGVTGTLELVVPLGARLGHPLWRKALRDCGVADEIADRVVERIGRGYVGWQENSFPGLLGNVVAGRVANRLDLGGTNCVVDAACASSLSALHLAALELQTGRCDVAITGGVDTFNDIFMYMCFSKTPALSPTGDARPFAADADGTILGEGLGIVVLKRLSDAERDGNRIYAVIKGMGTSSDGKGNAVYAPSSAGQVNCLRDAYRNAGVTADSIELIEAHGTGTRVGDAAEVAGLTEVFRDSNPHPKPPLQGGRERKPWCALGSVKSQLGHTKAAAGAAGLIKAALALYHKVLPPTMKVAQPLVEPGETPFYVNTECRPWLPRDAHPRRAGVSAFGFGGSNFHCVLEEHDRRKREIDWDGDIAILALSVSSLDELKTQVRAANGGDGSWPSLRARAADTRRTFDSTASHRLIVVAQRDHLPNFKSIESWLDDPSRPAPDGVYYGAGAVEGQLGFLFPGQGSQSVGMLRELACTFPVMQDVLAEADRAFAAGLVDPGETRLSDFIYPQPAFTSDGRVAQDEALRATAVAQPALGAVSLGALQVLAQFGIKPDATAGHSYGELTALCAAGCFDAPSLFELSQLRGRLMAQPHDGDAGAMLAIQAPLESIESLLEQDSLDLVIANKNGPTQSVLSGCTMEIDRAAKSLQSRRVAHVRLPVAAAFHSPLVAGAAGPFRAALEPIPFHAAQLPVFANTTAREYPRDPQLIRDMLAQQIAKPVEFVEQIRNMVRAGVRTFVEVGPGRTLTRLVESILADEPHHVVALDASAGKRSGMIDLAHTLARLAALGHPLGLSAWDPDPPSEPTVKSALTVPICGANYRKTKPQDQDRQPLAPSPTKTQPPASPARPQIEPKIMAHQPSPDPSALQRALQVTQESLAAFQRLQEQTAQLHKQFLETQESAQQTLQTLVEGQHRIVAASLGMPVASSVVERPVTPKVERARVVAAPAIERPRENRAEPAPLQPTPLEPKPQLTEPSSEHIQQVLTTIIAEKTGYPPEMLGLDMGLDADLGIDSIKRVEILSALQEKLPDAPVVKPEHLGTLHTLREIVAFLSATKTAESPGSPAGEQKQEVQGLSTERVQDVLIAIIAEKTGYPPEMLGLDMGLDADLGIDSIKRVEILSALQEKLPEAPVVKPEHLGTLHTLREIVAFLCADNLPRATVTATRPLAAASPLDRRVLRAVKLPACEPDSKALRPGAVYWIVADDSPFAAELHDRLKHRGVEPQLFSWGASPPPPPAKLSGIVLLAPAERGDAAKTALRWLQVASPALRRSAGQLASVTQLDGQFGLSPTGPSGDPTLGALAGLTKTASHEWPEVTCKAIDLGLGVTPEMLVDELCCAGPIEVGIAETGRTTLEATSSPLTPTEAMPFGPRDVIIVTGGARGVTAEVAVELARNGATLVLLGRSPEPQSEPADIAECRDEVALKRKLASRANATPRQIDAEVKTILAAREVGKTLERVSSAGGRAIYRTVDVRDRDAVQNTVTEIRRTAGPITAVVHGAGVLADRRIEDLKAEQFESVYETKVRGLQNVLAATTDDPLAAIVLFSSSTGRFGRTGQAAYAAANEALNKLAQRESRRRPACRVLALNWGPWAGGMVTPPLARVFASEGIGLIPLADGARHLVAELSASDRGVEVIVLGLGTEPPQDVQATAPVGVVFERELDLERAPVLRAHVIDGRAVLPLALTLEWLAHAAMHGHPGLAFQGCDQLRVFHPVLVREGEKTLLQVSVGKPVMRDGVHRVPVEIRGRRADGREVAHSRAEVLLHSTAAQGTARIPEMSLPPFALDPDDVYQRILFHGPELRGIEQIVGCGPAGIVVTAQSAPAPSMWLDQPLRGQWLADPLVLDCAFQAMSVWCHAQRGAVSLPSALGAYRQYRRFPSGTLSIACRVVRTQGQIVVAEIEFRDATGEIVARIDEFECVLDPSLNQAFRRNRLERAAV